MTKREMDMRRAARGYKVSSMVVKPPSAAQKQLNARFLDKEFKGGKIAQVKVIDGGRFYIKAKDSQGNWMASVILTSTQAAAY